jgi:hypothetical protein
MLETAHTTVPLNAQSSGTQPPPSTRPTHVVIAPAEVFSGAGGRGASVQRLAPGTLVTLVETAQGWILVARDGKTVGYVAQNVLGPVIA